MLYNGYVILVASNALIVLLIFDISHRGGENVFSSESREVQKYKRDPIEVNKEYVNSILENRHVGFSLTERDILILQLLYEHYFLTTEQIEMMAFSDLKPSNWRTKANQRIRKLYLAHCVDRWFPPVPSGTGSAQQHVILDVAGIMILESKHFVLDGIKRWKNRGYLVNETYKYISKIYDFKSLLVLLSNRIGHDQSRIMKWNTHTGALLKCLGGVDSENESLPAAYCEYWCKNRGHKRFYLEIDYKELSIHSFKDRIKENIKKDAYTITIGNENPFVLILTDSEKRRDEIKEYIELLDTKIKFYLTVTDNLSDREYVTYTSKKGKKREVLSEIKVNIFEEIWTVPYKSHRVRI